MGTALDTAKHYYDSMASGDFEGIRHCFHPSCQIETPAGTMNVEEHEGFARSFKQALPDAHMEIRNSVEQGDSVFIEGRFKGTQTADLITPHGTIPASGRRLDMPLADYFRVQSGRIVEHRVYWDQGVILAQLAPNSPHQS